MNNPYHPSDIYTNPKSVSTPKSDSKSASTITPSPTTKPNTWWWILILISIVIGLGVLLHYTYEWSGENSFVGSFSATNESVWEHLKLLFYPLIIASLIQFAFLRQHNLGPGIALGSIVGILLIMMLFYTYVGAFTHPDSYVAVDISIFIISSIVAVMLATAVFSMDSFTMTYQILAWALIVLILIMFIVFTYKPPNVPLFVSQE